MTPPNIVVSAHGGRWSSQEPGFELSGGGELVFYVRDGECLDNPTGYAILAALEAGNEPGGMVVQRIFAGGYTYDYSCWYAPEFGAYCGIYEVGSASPIGDLRPFTSENPLPLSDIVAAYPGRTIYWDCCREVTPGAEGDPLRASPHAYPS